MKIENRNQILFKANFINKISVGKIINKNHAKYDSLDVSFVRIDPSNKQDINALEDAAKYWEYDKFAKNIYYAACALRNKSKYYKDNNVYALTYQTSDFKNMNSNKILGLVQTSHLFEDSLFIEHLQVNPRLVYEIKPEYKGVGTAILSSLKWLYNKISCCPSVEKYVKNFYIKNGFKKEEGVLNYYVWEQKL